ncbi:TetR/AcrR family transcriptional regulator [Micromonospora sp. CA-263727]|uniref:TetR/AcrR family transcriptional regulator n=1 Tax=Micromonospora sp. CA-263727 TaxID=3239967 RepID=UPI003D8F2869
MTRGRRRSEASRLAILDAARSLLLERGYDQLTIEAIAARAGVGKQTVYRWWRSKSAVVAEAALDGGLAPPLTPLPDTGDIAADLLDWLRSWIAHLSSREGTSLILGLTAATTEDQSIADTLHTHFTGPHERLVRQRLEHARAAGQLSPDAPLAMIASVLIGSLLYRVLRRQSEPLPHDADELVRLVLHGATRRAESGRTPSRAASNSTAGHPAGSTSGRADVS